LKKGIFIYFSQVSASPTGAGATGTALNECLLRGRFRPVAPAAGFPTWQPAMFDGRAGFSHEHTFTGLQQESAKSSDTQLFWLGEILERFYISRRNV
jgi:hypothetical protein